MDPKKNLYLKISGKLTFVQQQKAAFGSWFGGTVYKQSSLTKTAKEETSKVQVPSKHSSSFVWYWQHTLPLSFLQQPVRLGVRLMSAPYYLSPGMTKDNIK